MRSFALAFLCAMSVCTASTYGQSTGVPPLQVVAGTVVTFYSQTRLHPGAGNALDALPRGTTLKVKLLETINSNVDHDGLEFRGALVTPLQFGNEVIVHSDAEVHGLLVLLRSRNHPEGFRYELVVTSVNENGKCFEMTASLNPSFFDEAASHAAPPASNETSGNDREPATHVARVNSNKN